MKRWTDREREPDRRTVGQMDRWMDEWTDKQIDFLVCI